jgi:hypothetical protein
LTDPDYRALQDWPEKPPDKPPEPSKPTGTSKGELADHAARFLRDHQARREAAKFPRIESAVVRI